MCLIVDVNIAREVFGGSEEPEFFVIRQALYQKASNSVKLVYGGHLRVEYLRVEAVRRALRVLDQAGRARQISDAVVDAEQKSVEQMSICVSNDTHIIALARTANVRLLCSHDQALHTDFTNKKLIDEPRGKVYQKAAHKHLIKKFCAE